VETVVAPNIDVIKRGILLRYVTKLGSKSGGVSVVRNLTQSSTLLIITTRITDTLQMVFTNPITTIHLNMIINRPLMNSMAI